MHAGLLNAFEKKIIVQLKFETDIIKKMQLRCLETFK